MTRVIIDLDELSASVLTFTAVGSSYGATRLSIWAMQPNKNKYARIDENGTLHFEPLEAIEE